MSMAAALWTSRQSIMETRIFYRSRRCGSAWVAGSCNVRLCVPFGGREHLSEERFFSPPKPPSLSKDFYSRYRVQHWLHHYCGAVPQPALCAIAGIKVFGKKGARGEKNLSLERCFPLEQFAKANIAIPGHPMQICICENINISIAQLIGVYAASYLWL